MADLIDREQAINTALGYLVEYCGAAFDEDMQKCLEAKLNRLPFVDAVPVVRCKDCAYCVIDPSDGLPWCPEFYERTVEPDDYCSKAVRR